MALRPLIAICGTTGVGKSNIAVELALRLQGGNFKHGWRGGKIINADSMQVYEGLDIITNKMPHDERKGVEHLLMDFKKPGEQYVVGQWVHDAMKLIDEMHENKEVPIVVGGTSYWIQHLVFPDRLIGLAQKQPNLESKAEARDLIPDGTDPEMVQLFEFLPESPPSASMDPDAAFKMHTLLSIIDPVMAARWHWRDARKVLRSLQIIKETGRRASEIVFEQTSRSSISKPRFRTLFFWLYAEPSILEKRLHERVDRMIELGLLDELRALHMIASEASSSKLNTSEILDTDYSLGIYQAIGYKEFHDYLSNSESSPREFLKAVDRMKLSTRQYAKRQISWIRNKLIPTINSANEGGAQTAMYLLDATELGDQWSTNALEPAVGIMQDFLDEKDTPDSKTLSKRARELLTVNEKNVQPTAVLEARRKIICSVCTIDETRPVMIEQGYEWSAHQKTRSHKRLAVKAEQGNRTSGVNTPT